MFTKKMLVRFTNNYKEHTYSTLCYVSKIFSSDEIFILTNMLTDMESKDVKKIHEVN